MQDMAEEKVQFKYDKKSTLPSVPVNNGMIHAVIDTGELHIDYNGARVRISDIDVYETEDEIFGLFAPKSKFYYCKDTGALWFKNGVWKRIGGSNVKKCAIIDIATSNTTSNFSLKQNWLVNRVSFIPLEAYTGSSDTIHLNISCGSQNIIPLNDLEVISLSSQLTQYDSFKISKINSEKSEISVSFDNTPSTGSGMLVIEYTIID